jgi:hypothetical protein
MFIVYMPELKWNFFVFVAQNDPSYYSAVLAHEQLPGGPVSIGAHASLCMLFTACFV